MEVPGYIDQVRGEFAQELRAACSGALEAGKILRHHWHDRDFTINEKSRDDPVTTADLEADRKLREILHGGFPEYGWLSEETTDDGTRLEHDRGMDRRFT
jgi:myo-inositol-1(or 4)-monophosphatase